MRTLLLCLCLCGCGGETAPVDTETAADAQCAAGEIWAEPGCGLDGTTDAPLVADCYVPCDAGCPDGTTCTTVWLNPCICDPGDTCCGSCGAEGEICLPE